KFGLRGFALGLREDLRPHGVGVSLVLPGFIRDAGMFAEANVELPRGVGTRSPEEVAAGVLKAIEQNRAEVEVAPLGVRLGATFGSAPVVASGSRARSEARSGVAGTLSVRSSPSTSSSSTAAGERVAVVTWSSRISWIWVMLIPLRNRTLTSTASGSRIGTTA